MNHPIAATAQASSESETSKAARPPEKAPLFYLYGIRDAEGEELQPVYYHIRHVANSPVGTITVASSTGANFSAKVCRYFDGEPFTAFRRRKGLIGMAAFTSPLPTRCTHRSKRQLTLSWKL